jgi:hypothetical protein
MLNKIKLALGFTSVQNLQKASTNIVDVFQKTVDELHNINSLIEIERSNKEKLMQRIADNLNSLNLQQERNSKIAGKIENILN